VKLIITIMLFIYKSTDYIHQVVIIEI